VARAIYRVDTVRVVSWGVIDETEERACIHLVGLDILDLPKRLLM
jgi:hypothetical protein